MPTFAPLDPLAVAVGPVGGDRPPGGTGRLSRVARRSTAHRSAAAAQCQIGSRHPRSSTGLRPLNSTSDKDR